MSNLNAYSSMSYAARLNAFNAWQAARATRGSERTRSIAPEPGTLEFRGHGRLIGSSLEGPRTRIDFVRGTDKVHLLGQDKFGPRTILGDASGPGFTLLTGYDPNRLLDAFGNLTSSKCRCKDKVSFILKRTDDPGEDSFQLRCKKCMGVIKSKCDSKGKTITLKGESKKI